MSKPLKVFVWVIGILVLVGLAIAVLIWRLANQFDHEQVTEDLHVIYNELGGNVAVLATGEGAVIVDTLTFVMQGRAIRELAEELTGEEVAIIINTHWHADHTHGNPAFGPNIRVVSTERTKAILEALDGDYWQDEAAGTLPNETFEEMHRIRLGDKTIELYWPGRGHTDGDLVALFKEDRAIHMGDLHFHRLYPFVDLETGGSVQAWGGTLNRVLELAFDQVVPGHGPLTTREGLVQFQALMEDLARLGRQAKANSWSLEETLERGELSTDAGYEALGIGPVKLVDRDFVIQRAWEEVNGEFELAEIGETDTALQACGPTSVKEALIHADAVSPQISGEYLRSVVAEISSDAYEGRGPGSEGDRKAREWVAAEFRAMGVTPGANGDYDQDFDLVEVTSALDGNWVFSSGFSAEPGSEYIANVGNQSASASLDDAELVFVGYGIQAPEYDWDDYKSEDVSGKVLVMLNNDPEWDPELFAGERRLYYGRWTYKYEIAAALGAVGAIVIHTTPSAGYPWQVVETSWTGPQFELPAEGEPRISVAAWLTEDAARRLFESAGHDLDAMVESARSHEFSPVALGIRTSFDISAELGRVQTANVLGLIPGCDLELRQEAVVITAHLDHLGVGEATNEGEDVIYNGALDNASGVAEVLAIAKALKALPEPPRRSILFALVGAEEQGLLGSAYYAKHPTFHPGRISANVNLDGANIWGEASDMIFVGLGKSSLDSVTQSVADYTGRSLHGDQFPDRGYYYRSDQFSFAKIGVPGAYLDGGVEIIGKPKGWGKARIDEYTEKNYHQPSDELTDDWVFDGMVEDTRFALLTTYLIAQADEMQSWNPGDEFAALRAAALQSLESPQ